MGGGGVEGVGKGGGRKRKGKGGVVGGGGGGWVQSEARDRL